MFHFYFRLVMLHNVEMLHLLILIDVLPLVWISLQLFALLLFGFLSLSLLLHPLLLLLPVKLEIHTGIVIILTTALTGPTTSDELQSFYYSLTLLHIMPPMFKKININFLQLLLSLFSYIIITLYSSLSQSIISWS